MNQNWLLVKWRFFNNYDQVPPVSELQTILARTVLGMISTPQSSKGSFPQEPQVNEILGVESPSEQPRYDV